ncbi:MAG: LPS assembly lipoprotein LptE [Methylophilaceae bacterium]
MKLFFKSIVLITIAVYLSACGFELRGNINTNLSSVAILGGTDSFSKLLKRRIMLSSIILKNPQEADKVIEIIQNSFKKNILSLSGGGKVREYELEYTVTYRFKSKKGEWGEPLYLEVIREYTYDDDDLLAKDQEEEKLINGMQFQLVKNIITQISLSK